MNTWSACGNWLRSLTRKECEHLQSCTVNLGFHARNTVSRDALAEVSNIQFFPVRNVARVSGVLPSKN